MTDWFDENLDDWFPDDPGDNSYDEEGNFIGDYEGDEGGGGMPPDNFPRVEDILILASGWDEELTNALNLFTDISYIDVKDMRGQQFQTLTEAYEWLNSLHLTGYGQIFAIPNSDLDGLLTYGVTVHGSE